MPSGNSYGFIKQGHEKAAYKSAFFQSSSHKTFSQNFIKEESSLKEKGRNKNTISTKKEQFLRSCFFYLKSISRHYDKDLSV